jgi:hypothetical protein
MPDVIKESSSRLPKGLEIGMVRVSTLSQKSVPLLSHHPDQCSSWFVPCKPLKALAHVLQ